MCYEYKAMLMKDNPDPIAEQITFNNLQSWKRFNKMIYVPQSPYTCLQR